MQSGEYIKLQKQIIRSNTEHIRKFKLYQMSNSEPPKGSKLEVQIRGATLEIRVKSPSLLKFSYSMHYIL